MFEAKALFLTRYARQGASSRYRVYQYKPFIDQAGIECVIHPLFSDEYLQRRYRALRAGRLALGDVRAVLLALMKRWSLLRISNITKYDVVFLQYEALPYLPLMCEQGLFTCGPGVVTDYDDAMHTSYEQHPNPWVRSVLGPKISGIVRRSHQVIAANKHLADWAGMHNSHVTLIPTSVDLDKYRLDHFTRSEGDVPIIGWIGTPTTARYLKMLERPLRNLQARHDFQLKVIGVPGFRIDGVDVVNLAWREVSEVRDLLTCDIGVMPLPDDAWARGKSALKLLQYMAAGVAVVASPVGANLDVVADGENGLLAETQRDWVEKLALLIDQPILRERLATAGRRTVEASYSVQANAPRLVEVLRRAMFLGRSN